VTLFDKILLCIVSIVIYFAVAQHRDDGGGDDDDDDHWKIYNLKLLCLQEIN
jgi:hypothetical protein